MPISKKTASHEQWDCQCGYKRIGWWMDFCPHCWADRVTGDRNWASLPEFDFRTGGEIKNTFMGSGTTLEAAKQEGATAVGIEIEERWCEVAAQRLAQGVLLTANEQVRRDSAAPGGTNGH